MWRARTASISDRLILILIPSLIFSYVPVISLGRSAGMSIDLSFIYILASITVAATFISSKMRVQSLLKNVPLLLLTCFVFYMLASIAWTANTFRGLTTSLFSVLLLGLVVTIATHTSFLHAKWPLVQRLSFVALIAASLWGIWQIIADAFGLLVFTGLPPMYTGEVFGVARPIGFALEPQFFGSLLLVPFLWSAYQLLTKPFRNYAVLAFILSLVMLLLTLSRGALIAAGIGGILMLLVSRPTFARTINLAGLAMVSILIFVASVFLFASVRADAISGTEALKRTVSQLSLGVIEFDTPKSSPSPTPTSPSPLQPSAPAGYVAESTDSRLTMSARAIDLWMQSPATILTGVGIGGFGASIHAADATLPISSVVNNYYVELLVETGLIGAGLFAAFLLSVFVLLLRRRLFAAAIILLALLLQMLFFSGNANILHIWAFIGYCIGVVAISQKSARSSERLLQ